jgi:aspartyl-tRNA(Asn)/glutamyl-tRNA(Gln) amidotransferase subunit B
MNKDLNKKFIYGLEIHVQLNTKRKLFSSSLNDAYSIENQNVSLFDLGVAGVFPRLNAESIILAMKACAIFNSTIATNITFDRKHYRYLDLPHSYQTTQFDNPIGRGGEYYINKVKSITLDNIHLETDAAKLKEYDDKIVIDYNRCSVSLIEIVTNPDFRQIEEIELFINLLVQDLQINNISEAKFEMSQIRVDVNLSMIDDNEKSITPRLELKNLNSIRNIRKAVLLAQQLLQTKL